MKTSIIVLAVMCLCQVAHADIFNMGQGLKSLETVIVSDPGNVADITSYGAVSYEYRISKYEVTAGQYCEYLNHKAKSDPYKLYNISMDDSVSSYGCNIKRTGINGSYSYTVAADWANKPVNYVSYWDTCRFANWLGNGQGDGDTETGAYTLGGYTDADGSWIQRNAGAKWAVTSEDEWYKAAYYKGMGIDAGYWDYPTKSDFISIDMANYITNYNESVGCITDVGSYLYPSAYGTYDQGGNVWEWNEAMYDGPAMNIYRGSRGGSYWGLNNYLCASHRSGSEAWWQDGGIGFRVVQIVPEPASLWALVVGVAALGPYVRRLRM